MNQVANKPSVTAMLRETQTYRASLESLFELGKTLLNTPSMEATSAVAFQVLTENVLEQADHQGDLVVVDGVDEPEAKVELIMQDVLTPRLTEVEAIEQALAAKEDDDSSAFFTSHHATQVSAESYSSTLELLSLHSSHIKAVREAISMEGMTPELARPLVSNILSHFGEHSEQLGVSMESVGQTQVLGEMSDAVERIEMLVEKAHEQVVEQAEAFRSEAAQVGSEDSDRLGALIEKYREENPSGAILDSDTKVSSVDTDTPNTDESADDDGELVEESTDADHELVEDESAEDDTLSEDESESTSEDPLDETQDDDSVSSDESDEDLSTADEVETTDETDLGDETDETGDPDESDESDVEDTTDDFDLNDETEASDEVEAETDALDDSDVDTDTSEVDESETSDEVNDVDDTADEEETDLDSSDETLEEEEVTADTEDEGTTVQLEGDDDQSEEEEDELEEETEEEEEGTASTESLTEPVVFDPDVWGERAPEVRGFHTQLLQWMSFHDLLSPAGSQILENDAATDFVLSTDLMIESAADVLAKHYETWINAALRDGEANMLSLGVLMGV